MNPSSLQSREAEKLAPKWQGPYRVEQQVGPENYKMVFGLQP